MATSFHHSEWIHGRHIHTVYMHPTGRRIYPHTHKHKFCVSPLLCLCVLTLFACYPQLEKYEVYFAATSGLFGSLAVTTVTNTTLSAEHSFAKDSAPVYYRVRALYSLLSGVYVYVHALYVFGVCRVDVMCGVI